MTTYKVILVASAAKEFRSLPSALQRRISIAIDGLAEDPRPRGVRKLAGHESLYRIRVGDYRIVYEIQDEERIVRITRIRHRREVYR